MLQRTYNRFIWQFVVAWLLLANNGFAQYGETHVGYQAHDNLQLEADGNAASVCQHLQTLIRHHDHEITREFIYETLAENPAQPDCFFYNARSYFNHKISLNEKHPKSLFDSLMRFYEHWFAVSRHPNNVLNFKGLDLRNFYKHQPDSLRKYCALYKRIYEADRHAMHPYNLKVLSSCACDLNGHINVDTLWEFARHQAHTLKDVPWKAAYKSLKRDLIACPKISCEHLHKLLHPILASGKEGSEETHKLHALMAQRKCSGHETAQETKTPAASSIQPEVTQLPFDDKMQKAHVGMESKDYKKAFKLYEEALTKAASPVEKADAYLGMAVASDSMSFYVEARKYGKLVHETLPDETDGLKFLFKLYQKGEAYCGFHSAKEMAAYYILLSKMAWDLGNTEEADAWKENANLYELYHTGTAKKGDKVTVGCFINEEIELP